LGPWADGAALPRDVDRTERWLEQSSRRVRCYHYQPLRSAPSGCYLVVPGLHYQGPDDPRLDRFCRVLAAAGLLVVAPFLNDYLSLVVAQSATTDARIAAEHTIAECTTRGLPRPALFSISFGSTPAIEVAGDAALGGRIGALMVFGGFADFGACIRFAVSRRAFRRGQPVQVPHDPLNGPAVFINVARHLDLDDEHRRLLCDRWLQMAQRTWGRLDMRPRAVREPIARQLANTLPEQVRTLFLVGCGLTSGAAAWLEAGLSSAGDAFAYTDPAPALARIRAPVVIAHGRDDDVIPYVEAEKLRDALPAGHPHQLQVTGMYGHTGAALPSPRQMADEVQSLFGLIYAMVDAPHEALG
jgi:pimeloyl-ACP methyl ester carboxylesterase